MYLKENRSHIDQLQIELKDIDETLKAYKQRVIKKRG